MDFQYFVDSVDMPCCILAVQKTAEDTCGEIRIIAANKRYKKTMGPAYYDGMLYSELVPQDNRFEDYCYRAAILKQRMRAYVETSVLGCWTDETLIPLGSDREDLGYCHDDIFRTGGDEFIVITDRISKETFERKKRRLRRDAEKNGLSFAMGSFWSDGSAEIKSAFRHADEMMYTDKKAFYEENPELRRK